MSEVGEIYGAMRDMRKHLRAKYGVPCPECVRKLPKANPTILLPQHRCRIHGYRDPRPESLMDGEYEAQS
jgi:hypothetical protein